MDLVKPEDKEILENYQQQQVKDALNYKTNSKSPKSLRTYKFGWKKFCRWCEANLYDPFNPPTGSREFLAALFIASMAKKRALKDASLSTYLAAIKHYYGEKGLMIDISHEEIRKIRAGIKRDIGTKQVQKTPLTTENIKVLIDSIVRLTWPIEVRDKALILFGFSGAFRRSELIGIDLEHLDFDPNGVSVFLPKSKTDQTGQGRTVDIPFSATAQYCPVRAIQQWIACARVKSGPVFRQLHKSGTVTKLRLGGASVALILKKRCAPFGFSGKHCWS